MHGRKRLSRLRVALVAAILGGLYSGDAHADFSPGYEVGAFGGAKLWNRTDPLGRSEARTETTLQHSAGVGMRAGLELHPRWSLEAELLLAPTHTADATTNVLAFGYRLHALLHVLTGRVRPFVLLGGGGLSNTTDNPSVISRDTIWNVNGGLGVKVAVSGNIGLRLDARLLLLPCLPGCYPVVAEEEIFLGFYIRVGSGAPPPKVAADKQEEKEQTEEKEKKEEAKSDAKPGAKSDAKTDAKPEAKPDAKPDAKSDVKPDSKPDEKPAGQSPANEKAGASP